MKNVITQTSNHTFFSEAAAVLSLILSGAEEAFFLVDRDLSIRFYNDTARKRVEKLLGKTLHNGASILSLVPEASRISILKKVYAAVFNDVAFESEQQLLRNGVPYIYHYHVQSEKIDACEIIAAIVTVYNVTEKRIVENALKENEDRLRFALESGNSIFLHKQNTGIELMIHDDGIDFDPEKIKKGAGLKNIKNRVYLNNGKLQICSSPGSGCLLTIRFNM